ncbi:MAG: hypothetical protein OXE74_06145 [Cyanobacteria bacterium MAG CAR2_bin_4]|nr:hypothetical protein [Cyanobacteria bacterium MAG CAR2_bin_4]
MCEQVASTIQGIIESIRTRSFKDEAQISQGVILLILKKLGWPVFKTQVVTPQFPIGDGARKVDYGLCTQPGKADILIEVKSLGKADEKGQRQLFEYAFHQGIPIAVLTDGRIWNFFYPPGRGDYAERLFAKVDLLDDNFDILARSRKLARYLSMENVRSHKAWRFAQDDHEKAQLSRRANLIFPSVWNKLLLEPGSSLLLELFMDEVAEELGFHPDLEQTTEYIRSQAVDRRRDPQGVDPQNSVSIRSEPKEIQPASSEGNWIQLDRYELDIYDLSRHISPPKIIKFPNGIKKNIRNWKNLLVVTAEWLNDTGQLEMVSTPILSGPREKVLHTDKSAFRNSTPIAKTRFWLHTHGNARQMLTRTQALLKHCRVNLEDTWLCLADQTP